VSSWTERTLGGPWAIIAGHPSLCMCAACHALRVEHGFPTEHPLDATPIKPSCDYGCGPVVPSCPVHGDECNRLTSTTATAHKQSRPKTDSSAENPAAGLPQ
jgi:hypothetical protein